MVPSLRYLIIVKSNIEYIMEILFTHLEYIQIDLFIFVGELGGKTCCCFSNV